MIITTERQVSRVSVLENAQIASVNIKREVKEGIRGRLFFRFQQQNTLISDTVL